MVQNLAMLVLISVLAATGAEQSVTARRAIHNTEIGEASEIDIPSDDYDVPPKRISGKAPIFPISQLMNGSEGRTFIVFTIGTDGRASNFEVVESTAENFADHAIVALKEWRFRPAEKNGKAVAVRVGQEFHYSF